VGLRDPHDAAAWSRFVYLYTPLLYTWARRTGLQEADAADLVQDVFTVLVKELPAFRYDAQRSFRGWLHTILLNRWRALQRRRRPTLLDSDQLTAVPAPGDPELPSEAEERRLLVQRTLTLLKNEFPASSWQAFWQTWVDGCAPAEVATRLGLSLNAVYISRSRVLKRLRLELAGLLD
jgi:RNA polymerase sigma-70 factor (ECF subfamily)